MNENKIIAAFIRNRVAWETAKSTITTGSLSPTGELVLNLIGEYYDADREANRCDVDILASRVERTVQSNKLAQAVVEALHRLPEDVSAINVARELSSLRKDSIGKRLASLLAAGRSGKEVRDLIEEYQQAGTGEPASGEDVADVLVGPAVKDLVQKSFSKEGLIQLWPKVLNDHI